MPDQVLCKKATVERMRAQQARWFAQREEALRASGELQQARVPSDCDVSSRRTAQASIGKTSPPAQHHIAQEAASERLLAAAEDQTETKQTQQRAQKSPTTNQYNRSCAALVEENDEDLDELDDIQDFFKAMEFQISEIDSM